MGYVEVRDEQFPDDVDQIYLNHEHPGLVYIRTTDALHVWSWDQALTFAVELARLAGMACVHEEASPDAFRKAMRMP